MKKFNTNCVQAGYTPTKSGEPRVLPLVQSTTFYYENGADMAYVFDNPTTNHLYSRISNPTVSAFEAKMATLENGVGALACASGQAATTCAIFAVCEAGDNILASGNIYGGTFNLFNITLPKFGITTKFFDQDAAPAEIEKLIDAKTKMVFVESLANPAMSVVDFDKIAKICKKHGILFVVDNTLTTPYVLQPKKYGANVCVHSSSKYLDGHAAALGGVIVDMGNFQFLDNPRYPGFNTPDPSYKGLVFARDAGEIAFILKCRAQIMRDMGGMMSPFNAYLTNLGTETLHLRMQRTGENALKIAQFLQKHKNVEWINYPGLAGDKYKSLADKYFEKGTGYSGMLTIGTRGGREGAQKFLEKLSLFACVTHIADARSCALHPATTTHRQLSDSDLLLAGVKPNLVRISVGIEDADDLIADLTQALDY
jgi:O-acetylhomoserine (thiol)-lyase